MAPADEALHEAQDWMLDQAEKEGCGERGHAFVCRALRTQASEWRKGFKETQQQIALLPGAIGKQFKGARAESRVAPMWALVRELPTWGRVVFLLGLLTIFPSVVANTVGQIIRAILEQPVALDAAARAAVGAVTGAVQ